MKYFELNKNFYARLKNIEGLQLAQIKIKEYKGDICQNI